MRIGLARFRSFAALIRLQNRPKSPARKLYFLKPAQPIGAIQALAHKYSCLRKSENVYFSPHPVPDSEGRFAIVTNVGCGMRWTWRPCETSAAGTDGEI